ncbi:hypothetical protein MLD38_020295 [Melastoma candidum]|nr:hypothetical protein MLD38_020295 [Melastoma candidum]
MEILLIVGLWCTNSKDKERPKIGEVIKVLKREVPVPELPLDMHDHDNFTPDSTHGMDQWRLSISSTRT